MDIFHSAGQGSQQDSHQDHPGSTRRIRQGKLPVTRDWTRRKLEGLLPGSPAKQHQAQHLVFEGETRYWPR